MIRSRNVDSASPGNEFAQESVMLAISAAASQAGVIQSGWRAPYAGKVVSAHVYAATITDADDGVRIDLQKAGVTMLPATVDPVAADTMTSLAPTVLTFAAGDKITVVATTGAGDAMIGNVILIVRPLLGTEAL